MANSDFYTVTKEDARQWRTYQDTTASAADSAAVAHASTLQSSTQASNPVDGLNRSPTATTVTAAAGTTHTAQLTVTPKVGTVVTTSGVSVTWSSADTTKATVSSTGLVTGVATTTAVVITATAVHNTSVTTTVAVTVAT